ncbi:MAG: AGE family epimerase/isomerase [Ruminococcus sp.]|nr:AGE family epimerase/isomerase [Ruminococcus sp.]
MEAKVFQEHLENDLIPFWNRMKDDKNGGFYGYADSDGKPDEKSVKGVILNSRILWFYSSAYQILHSPELLEMADHAYKFLTDFCFDAQYGGVYWSVNYDGTVCDDTKHTYNQAFAIYALSAYYQASRRKEALNFAYVLYHVIEEKCRDGNGYLEAFSRNFSPVSNEKLSENGVIAERTMNTLLHVLEAYSELYKADTFYEVGDSIRSILRLFENKIYNSEKQICDVFFDSDYHSLIDLESFGHDIETSWLIDRSCRVLGDKAYQKKMQSMINGLADSAYRNAFDNVQNALDNERDGDNVDHKKIWWVQAEAVVGFYNAYQENPRKTEYLEASESIWNFIQHYVIDRKSGEWIENISPDNTPELNQALVHSWKCPYHNGRMCIEMIQRLSLIS